MLKRGECHNICEMVCVARRETSRGSALYSAALSKTARINSPSATVLGIFVFMTFRLSRLLNHHEQFSGHQVVGNEYSSLQGNPFLFLASSIMVT